ncbi:thioredoxin family protein [Sphingobacterium sp. SYP-B4668]|uniref:thioredoxin family protein n=1 Tax=Sphingobacterium sp. SYP-B4668 TaxID=2996035 RepID=UPI0022DDC715|nr:thioredoxin fold domain-containing protein [Sphingobacterium sp. SYP-B4668]
MKKYIILVIGLLGFMTTQAQEHIEFKAISFAEAKSLAKEQNKLIFLDGYTSWCAPCKWMEGNVFNTTAIASFYNVNFINTKFDCEKGEGIELAKKYNIRSFPTYLFLDSNGELIYRTQSRMEADEFLAEGKRALNPETQIPTIQKRYTEGDRNPTFLLNYIIVMNKVNPLLVKEARNELDAQASDEFLRSAAGWKTIELLAQNANDRYGQFFMANRTYFKQHVEQIAFDKKELQILRYAMYTYIREKNEKEFKDGLQYFVNSTDQDKQKDGAMFEVEWVAAHGTPKEFVTLTNTLRKGILKDEAEKLSFIARRYGSSKISRENATRLEQCYVLAKQAVKMDPNSYSNQGTFADICITLKKKKEAVKAAEAARSLADLETSKIQKIAQELLDRAKAI